MTYGGVCRIEGLATPTPDSRIGFELHLPPPARWSGRYYQIGNGGFAGAIHRPTLEEGAARGDAIAGTDTGHRAGPFDASWAAGHPERVIDYGWRSIKATSDAARMLTAAYYRRAPAHRYFMGCSNGGRMALMAAARWPDEWDGVIAGAPANPWTQRFRDFAAIRRALDAPGGWLDAATIERIAKAARAACPASAKRGVIVIAPDRCHVPRLALTPAQHASVAAIRGAGYDLASIIPTEWEHWIANRTGPSQADFAAQATRYLHALGHAATLDIQPRDLTRYSARGGRIISYFGWSDATLPPHAGVAFYRAARKSHRDFYRLFMVPGMAHCQSGIAPEHFGQSLDARAASDDAEHDIRRALERWVEDRKAPETLIATDVKGAQRLELYH